MLSIIRLLCREKSEQLFVVVHVLTSICRGSPACYNFIICEESRAYLFV